nr:glycine cleavage system aminomethyltransferase GcvT [Ignavibacteriaceae bacterium]
GHIVLEDNGEEVGKLTSYVISHKLKAPIGLAYIRNSYLTQGTQISVKLSDNKIIKSEVHPLPFVK